MSDVAAASNRSGTPEDVVLRSSGFELDRQRADLRGPDGEAIKLRPKTLGILNLLAANAGRVLGKRHHQLQQTPANRRCPLCGCIRRSEGSQLCYGRCENGAQGRDRTTDTAIFSRMLYQLSYLGIPARAEKAEASGRFIERSEGAVHPPSRKASAGQARFRQFPQIIGKSTLFDVLDVVLAAGNNVGAGQPAVEVDVPAARRTERAERLLDRLVADRAGARGSLGFSNWVVHGGAQFTPTGDSN